MRFLSRDAQPGHQPVWPGADFTLLEASSQDEFVKHCERAAPVPEMIREARERQLRVVFVLSRCRRGPFIL